MKVVILDGRHEEDSCQVLDVLTQELASRGDTVELIRLRELHKMGSCIGCFKCWLKTPGICVEADEGRDIAKAVLHSDTVILLSPVTFGGYSSEIKKAQDRWIPLVLPDFGVYHKEVHHKPRYDRYPRWIGIGLQDHTDDEEAHIFRILVGRNALNFHAPSYAADVFPPSSPKADLIDRVQNLLGRKDPFPLGWPITSLMPGPVETESIEARQETGKAEHRRRALLLIGSPKISFPSTSGVFGGHVMQGLKEEEWETSTLTLRRNIFSDKRRTELFDEADKADLILMAFPLYIDSLPFLLMKSLEMMAEYFRGKTGLEQKSVVVIVNNGFPEAYQNAVAVSICRRFAIDTGMTWLGGLAMGAGEAIFRGRPFEKAERNPLPVNHVKTALDLTAAALAKGNPVPGEAIRVIKRTPIPIVPFRLWRMCFIKMANQYWREVAAEQHGTEAKALLDQPDARVGSEMAR